MNKKPSLFILLLLVSFASVGAVLITPALPILTSLFHLSVGQGQSIITSYLLGYALGQLPYGAYANRFGRLPTIYLGISISILASLVCVAAQHLDSFFLLLVGRFFQGLGACVGLKITFTMIADVFTPTQATKMISKTVIAFAIMPGIAIAIGGALTQWLGPKSVFYFLALFGAFILLLSTRLPETAPSLDKNALNLSSIAHHYGTQFKNKRLMLSALLMGCGTSVIYIFAAKAPFIGIDLIKMTPSVFGLYNLIPPAGMLGGSFLGSAMAGRLSALNTILIGTLGCLLMSLAVLIPFSLGYVNPWILFLPVAFIYLFESLAFVNVSSLGLSHAKNKSIGSAVLNFVNLATTVIAFLIFEVIYPEKAILLPISFLVFFFLMLSLWLGLKIDIQNRR